MRIGELTHNYPRFPGDFSGIFVELLCHELAAQGQEVTVIAPYDPAYRRPPSGDVSLRLYRYVWPDRLHRLGYMRSMQADLTLRRDTYLLSPLLLASGVAATLRWARQARPHILHAHWVLPNGLIAAMVARRLGIPLVVSVPGSDATIGAQNPLFRRLSCWVFDQAGLLTANSEALRDVSVQELGADPAQFDLIPYGLDPQSRHPDPTGTAELRARLGIPQDAVVFLAVGRMVPKKGFDRLVRALGRLVGADVAKDAGYTGPPLHLVMVGEGDLWREWQALGRQVGAAAFIHWVGNVPVDRMNVYYNMADVVTSPARERPATGLIVAVLEAMACGKPVLATDVGSNRLPLPGGGYVVEPGQTGLLVPDGDDEALAAALCTLAQDPSLRRRMGAACQQVAADHLSWPAIARRYIRHFRQLAYPSDKRRQM